MSLYELTSQAENDLKDIARYTMTQWGREQSLRYASVLEQRFRDIAKQTAHVLVTRCEQHYMFYMHPDASLPRIIAVLHERMDIVSRLAGRIEL